MKYVISLVKEIVKKRKMILDLALADFRKRFVGSYFGIVWMFLQPLVTVLIYWFIFGEYGMKTVPPVPNATYVVWLVPGLVPWFFYSEALNSITGCLQEYSYLVKKVVFKVEMLPVIKLLSCLLVHFFFVLIMLALYAAYRQPVFATWIQILYYTFAAAMLALAFGYFTSAVNVFFKDMANIVGICLQFGIWMTPIMWNLEDLLAKYPILMVLKLNPLCYIVYGYRAVLFQTGSVASLGWMNIYFWVVTILVWLLGSHVFRKLKVHFADVL